MARKKLGSTLEFIPEIGNKKTAKSKRLRKKLYKQATAKTKSPKSKSRGMSAANRTGEVKAATQPKAPKYSPEAAEKKRRIKEEVRKAKEERRKYQEERRAWKEARMAEKMAEKKAAREKKHASDVEKATKKARKKKNAFEKKAWKEAKREINKEFREKQKAEKAAKKAAAAGEKAREKAREKEAINNEWDSKIFNDKQFLTNMLTERMEDIDPKYLDALKEAIYNASDDEIEALLNLYGDPTEWKDFYKFNNENQAGYQSYNDRMGKIIAVLDFFDIDL